jgi:hypothetical protein
MQNALVDAGDRSIGKPKKKKLAGYQQKVIMTRSHDTDATNDRLQRVIPR